MAISVSNTSGKTTTYVTQYICDTEADVLNLPTNVAPGSSAIVVASGNVYMLNNQKIWTLFGGSGGGGTGGGGTTTVSAVWKPF